SNVSGAAKLYDFSDADGPSSQASLGQDTITFQGNAVAASHDVESARLDDVADEMNLTQIGLLKIDTEGFDLTVLQGASRLLAERRIRMIQFEIIPADIVRHVTVKDFFDVLDGYHLHRLCANGQLQSLEPYSVKSCEIYVPNTLVATLRS
ncbi:MAG: FkbM family methyltransferase, partial [Acetobacteraceae bacterium]